MPSIRFRDNVIHLSRRPSDYFGTPAEGPVRFVDAQVRDLLEADNRERLPSSQFAIGLLTGLEAHGKDVSGTSPAAGEEYPHRPGSIGIRNISAPKNGAPTIRRNTMNRKSLAIGMIIPLAAAGAVATAPAASATHEEDDGVTRTGFCDRPVDRLTLNATAFTNAAGKHKIELTLNFSTRKQRAINRDWTAVLRRTNPSQLIERDEDVDFTGVGVRRKYQLTETVANKPGVDHFRARVFNDLDQECVVKLNFRPTDDDDSEG